MKGLVINTSVESHQTCPVEWGTTNSHTVQHINPKKGQYPVRNQREAPCAVIELRENLLLSITRKKSGQ
jgi:hypothetical protein